jgi:hypothetical protein
MSCADGLNAIMPSAPSDFISLDFAAQSNFLIKLTGFLGGGENETAQRIRSSESGA